MGELLQLFYFNQGRMARKILSHDRRVDGLEAPRNSLELQVEASQSCCAAGDDLYSYEADTDWSRSSYPYEISMKKLINEEVSKRSNTRKNTPSIVARLMGVDTLPLDNKSATRPLDKKKNAAESKPRKKEKNGSVLGSHSSAKHSSRKMELDAVYHIGETDAHKWGDDEQIARPRRREHPQEEELQKFKKEFEAWQAARFRECSSKVVELGNISGRMVAPEMTSEQKKMDTWTTDNEESTKHRRLRFGDGSPERQGLAHDRHGEGTSGYEKEVAAPRDKMISKNFEPSPSVSYHQKQDTGSAPTRIVILKPGPDRFFDREDPWACCPGSVEERGNIEEFLEEVKERLKCELQGKAVKRGAAVRGRGSGIETPFSEKQSDPKQIARHIARQVRDSVTRDIGLSLLRSESTRSYRSEIQLDEVGSPELVNRDARRFLSERLRRVLRRERHLRFPNVAADTGGPSVPDSNTFRVRQLGGSPDARHWEIVKDEQVQTRSFRHGDEEMALHGGFSPRNLVRSLSAPVSGTSFGKLLLEDRHIRTGAHIRRKHEALDNVAAGPKRRKKDKFSIKERVSNLRYFTLKGRLFGKKMQEMVESGCNELKDIAASGPTVVINTGERRIMENSTEVPPSPASVCSNSLDELWKPSDYLSPVSTPDFSPGDDGAIPRAFQDISSNLNELRRQLNQLERNNTKAEEELVEAEAEVEAEAGQIEDEAEAYIRDLLVASGLYHGSSNKWLWKVDDMGNAVGNAVFEQVEEARKRRMVGKDNVEYHHGETKADRRMLFDLLNEVLPCVGGGSSGKPCPLRKRVADVASRMEALTGRRLVQGVWKMMQEHLRPPNDDKSRESDHVACGDTEPSHWAVLIEDEASAVGREVECLITAHLVDELVRDLHSFPMI